MFSYHDIDRAKGFQVSVIHSLHGTHLIGDFGSLQAAQIFADAMREIDLIATAAQDRERLKQTVITSTHLRANRAASHSLQ